MKLISFDKKDSNSAHVKIFINNSEFNEKLNLVWSRQKRWFNVPGFRKGKVPRIVIENEYGKSIFHESALGLLYPKMVDLIIKETKEPIIFLKEEIYMQTSPSSKPVEVKYDNDDGVTTEFDVNLYDTDIKLDYKNLKVEVEPKKTASKEDIEIRKTNMRMRSKKRSKDVEESVEIGDFVKLNIQEMIPEGVSEEDRPKYKKYKNINGFKLEINSDNPIANMLVGHSMKEGTFSSQITFPENFGDKDLAGKKTNISASIVAVKRLPTMDEVAQENNLEDEESLDNRIRDSLNKNYESVYEESKKGAMLDSLAGLVKESDVPETLVNAQKKAMMSRFSKMAKQYGMDESVFSQTFLGSSDINESCSNLAKQSTKIDIALRSVAKQENLTPSHDEWENFEDNLVKSLGKKGASEISDAQKEIEILRTKTIDYLMKTVSFVDKIETNKNEPKAPKTDESEKNNEKNTAIANESRGEKQNKN
jgi:trigger factor